jgi:hypothetical protein
MKWSDPQDRADRRLRLGIWTAAIIALLLPIWWNVMDTTWAAIVLRASVQAFAQAIPALPPPTTYRTPARVSSPLSPTPSVRLLGATSAASTVSVVVDLAGTTPAQSREKICRDGAAFLAHSLVGQTVRVLRSRGTQPASDAGTIVCP